MPKVMKKKTRKQDWRIETDPAISKILNENLDKASVEVLYFPDLHYFLL